jgi:general stress protein 26
MRQIRTLKPISTAIAALLMIAISTVSTVAATSAANLELLAKSSLIYIATVRKSGDQSKAVPIWFTTTDDGSVLINTSPDSWKAKRIRRGSPAMIWIGKADGPAFIGKAEITNDAKDLDKIVADYPKKYTIAWIGLFRPSRAKYEAGTAVAIRINPVRDLPEGFQSAPGTPAPALDASGNAPPAAVQ